MTKKHLRALFYLLILTLIFEGIIRKIMPVSMGKFILLFKDVILCVMAVGVLQLRTTGPLKTIQGIFMAFACLLAPLILLTATKDPILAVYGAKQYLLYPVAMFGFVQAFSQYENRDFVEPARLMTLLLVPLTMLAVVQIFLPDNHWLNLSVSGEDLSAFKAGGRLRVSSTFPFVAQFCYFLSILLPILWVTTTLKRKKSTKKWLKKIESLYILIPIFIVANVITGSRLAVVTNVMVIVFAAGLLLVKGKVQNVGRLIMFIIGIAISSYVARWVVPEAFQAYEARTGDSVVVDEEEMTERAGHVMLGWWRIYQKHDPGVFGFGIGVMSNGVQNFSGYAAGIRDRVWGETDLANTVLEGGLYFVIIWFSTRLLIVITCFRLYLTIQHTKLIYIASFLTGYIIFNGLTQTLGIQPPLAIWWWIAIGLLVHVKRFEIYERAKLKRRKEAKLKKSSIPKPPPPPNPGKRKPLPKLKPS